MLCQAAARRHPAQERERIHMGADPVGQRLAEPGLGEGVIRRLPDLAFDFRSDSVAQDTIVFPIAPPDRLWQAQWPPCCHAADAKPG